MKLLRIIRGLPGSGKSTLARTLYETAVLQGRESCVCEADHFMLDENGEYKFDRSKIEMCHIRCIESVSRAMERGTSEVIVSNTSVKNWERQPYLDLAEKFGYEVQEIIVKGTFGSIHGVPQATLETMKRNFEF